MMLQIGANTGTTQIKSELTPKFAAGINPTFPYRWRAFQRYQSSQIPHLSFLAVQCLF